jgi:hypothetical protein
MAQAGQRRALLNPRLLGTVAFHPLFERALLGSRRSRPPSGRRRRQAKSDRVREQIAERLRYVTESNRRYSVAAVSYRSASSFGSPTTGVVASGSVSVHSNRAVTILARRPTSGSDRSATQDCSVASLSPTALAVSLSAGSTQRLCAALPEGFSRQPEGVPKPPVPRRGTNLRHRTPPLATGRSARTDAGARRGLGPPTGGRPARRGSRACQDRDRRRTRRPRERGCPRPRRSFSRTCIKLLIPKSFRLASKRWSRTT